MPCNEQENVEAGDGYYAGCVVLDSISNYLSEILPTTIFEFLNPYRFNVKFNLNKYPEVL